MLQKLVKPAPLGTQLPEPPLALAGRGVCCRGDDAVPQTQDIAAGERVGECAAPYTLVARRDIAVGEEFTNDYATSTGEADFVMPCRCGIALCRGVVTGRDWSRPELQQRYGDHWVPGLLDRIRRAV